MGVKNILLLGHPKLYDVAKEVQPEELPVALAVIRDLHDTLSNFRSEHGFGRAVAAPQIGVQLRIIYMYLDQPTVFINPRLSFPDEEMMELWDDCMSFPGLLVKLRRYKRCRIEYLDEHWREACMDLTGDLAELLQHEYDHLDGILAVNRAIDLYSFAFKDWERRQP